MPGEFGADEWTGGGILHTAARSGRLGPFWVGGSMVTLRSTGSGSSPTTQYLWALEWDDPFNDTAPDTEVSWGDTTANTIMQPKAWSGFVDLNGTTLHVVRQDQQFKVLYNTYTVSGGWGTAEEIFAGDSNMNIYGCDIRVRNDGDVIVTYQGGTDAIMGTRYQRTDYARKEGGTWTANIATDEAGETNWQGPACAPSSSDGTWMCYKSTSEVQRKILSSANSLGSAIVLDSGATSGAWTHSFYYSTDGGTSINGGGFAWERTGSDMRLYDTQDGTYPTTEVFTDVYAASTPSFAMFVWDEDPDVRFAIGINGTSRDLQYRLYDVDNGGWQTIDTAYDTTFDFSEVSNGSSSLADIGGLGTLWAIIQTNGIASSSNRCLYGIDSGAGGPAEVLGAAALSANATLGLVARDFIEPTEGADGSPFQIPFTNGRYVAIWGQDTGTLSGQRGFRLAIATPERDGWLSLGPVQLSGSGGVGIFNNLQGAFRLSDTQAVYWHMRHQGGANIGRIYHAAVAYNSGTDTISNGGYGSFTLTPVGVSIGGTSSGHAARMTDTKALFSACQNTDASTMQVRAVAGTVSAGTDTGMALGTVVDFGKARGDSATELRVVGLSDTRAVLVGSFNDFAGTNRISARLISCTSGSGTTLAAVSSWVDVNTDFLDNGGVFYATKIDSTRFIVVYGSQSTSGATDRQLKAVVVDTSGDSISVGTAVTLMENPANITVTKFNPESHTVVFSNQEVFVSGNRQGNSPNYQSIASNTTTTGSITITKPAGTVDGDVLYAFFAIDGDNGTVTITPPSGWTFHKNSINSGNVGLRTYYKTASSEGADYTWTFSSSVTAVGAIIRTDSSVVDWNEPWSTTSTGSGNNPTLPVAWAPGTTVAISATDTDVAHTPPSGFTERLDLGAGSTVRLSIATDTAITTGASLSFTASSTNWATMHLPLPGVTSPSVGFLLDVGSSGTSISQSASPTALFPRQRRWSHSNDNESYATEFEYIISSGGDFSDAGFTTDEVNGFGFVNIPFAAAQYGSAILLAEAITTASGSAIVSGAAALSASAALEAQWMANTIDGAAALSVTSTLAAVAAVGQTVVAYATVTEAIENGWFNPENAFSDNGVYATAEVPSSTNAETAFQLFGLDGLVEPGSEILSVTIEVQWRGSSGISDLTLGARAYVNDVATGDEIVNTDDPQSDIINDGSVPITDVADLADGVFEVRVRATRP